MGLADYVYEETTGISEWGRETKATNAKMAKQMTLGGDYDDPQINHTEN